MLETWRKKQDSGTGMTIQMPASFRDSSVSFEEEKERGGEEFNIQDPGCIKFQERVQNLLQAYLQEQKKMFYSALSKESQIEGINEF